MVNYDNEIGSGQQPKPPKVSMVANKLSTYMIGSNQQPKPPKKNKKKTYKRKKK